MNEKKDIIFCKFIQGKLQLGGVVITYSNY